MDIDKGPKPETTSEELFRGFLDEIWPLIESLENNCIKYLQEMQQVDIKTFDSSKPDAFRWHGNLKQEEKNITTKIKQFRTTLAPSDVLDRFFSTIGHSVTEYLRGVNAQLLKLQYRTVEKREPINIVEYKNELSNPNSLNQLLVPSKEVWIKQFQSLPHD